MPAQRSRENTSEKLRDAEVLATAARVFHDRGYAASSVQVIADELGILKGSLYYYTKSKEELLYRILRGVYDDLEGILLAVEAERGTPLETVADYVRRQVEYAAGNLIQIAIYYRDADQLSQQHRDDIAELRRRHQQFLRDVIASGQADGSVRDDDSPSVLAHLIFGSFIWTYRWFRPEGSATAPQIAESASRFAVRAIASV